MIVLAITSLFEWSMGFVSGFFPTGGLDPTGQYLMLPFGLDSALTYVVGIWNTFEQTVPYVIVVWHMFLYFIIPFEVALIVVKLVFGSRTPVSTMN